MKKLFKLLVLIIGLLILFVIIKTLTFHSMQLETETIPLPAFDEESIGHLSESIKYPTVSTAFDSPVDTSEFEGFHRFLEEAYPLIHQNLKKEVFSSFSLLYTWEGTDSSLKPVILTAHMDVVPAGDTTSWSVPPFSGKNDGTFIWGRGTLDDKSSLISIMEAVEKLLEENFRPQRTLCLAFGHDEEISGINGAGVMAGALKERNLDAEFLIDEGYAVTIGMVPMIKKPVALIGTSEKGYLSTRLTVEMEGGHSAYPAKESAIIVLNRALNRIVDNQMKAKISEPVNDFIRYIGPEMPFYAKAIFANKWLFSGIILKIYEGGDNSNALVRTTTAPTILNAGIKDNVVPTKAEAVINFRILPGETSADVINHIKGAMDDERIRITELDDLRQPAPVSPVDAPGFDIIHRTIRQVYPEALVAPTMMIAASDSRKYMGISNNI
jgi:carboxypeptidase PM20D1